LKLLQERIGKTLEQIGIDNNFLNRTTAQQEEKGLTNGTASNLKTSAQQRKQSLD
jgi:hypothetical protein